MVGDKRYGEMADSLHKTGSRVLFIFVTGVVLAGLLVGYSTRPGAWYAALNKPGFNPPNYIFAPVWTALYVCVGIAGARTWSREFRGPAMIAWFAQMALNFLWSPTFFAWHRIDLALVIVVAMLFCIFIFIALQWRADRAAALCFVPYATWVAFAAALNWSIYRLNG